MTRNTSYFTSEINGVNPRGRMVVPPRSPPSLQDTPKGEREPPDKSYKIILGEAAENQEAIHGLGSPEVLRLR
jgi:hypothetical protein